MTQTRRAFTLVELMVVITIVIVLVGMLMIVVSKSMTAGRRVRAQADLQSIATALEAYRQDFGDFPRPTPGAGLFDSSQILCRVLVAPGGVAQDGADGNGFRIRKSPGPDGVMDTNDDIGQGKVYGPYIDVDKFDLTVYPSDGANHYVRSKVYTSNDGNPVPPILYLPKSVNAIRPEDHYVGVNVLPPAAPVSYMYDVTSLLAVPNIANNTWWPLMPASGGVSVLAQIQGMMGDKSAGTGKITSPDVPAFTGPYILWMPGADGFFGLTNSKGGRNATDGGYATDDVTNFNFDPAITVK